MLASVTTLVLNPNKNSPYKAFWVSPDPTDTVGRMHWNNFINGDIRIGDTVLLDPNAPNQSFDGWQFTLTHEPSVKAAAALPGKGVPTNWILNQGGLKTAKNAAAAKEMEEGGDTVTPSSEAFDISHGKSAIRNRLNLANHLMLISTENLSSFPWTFTRDYGLYVRDAVSLQDMVNMYYGPQGDLVNAKNGTALTPDLQSQSLVISPYNSLNQLTSGINSATERLCVCSENYGDPDIQKALLAAHARGVVVKVMAPMCVSAGTQQQATRNWPFLIALRNAGIDVRVMPGDGGRPDKPNTAAWPYLHAKVMTTATQADVKAVLAGLTLAGLEPWFYLGSENLSFNSLIRAREIGKADRDRWVAVQIYLQFMKDFAIAIPIPDQPPTNCPIIS